MARLPSDLSFQRFDATGARRRRDTVELIYRDAYADQIASGGTFESAEAAMARFEAYTSRDGFDLVIGYLGGEPAGQAWGWPLTATSAWWRGLLAEPEPGFTIEDGARTFAFSPHCHRANNAYPRIALRNRLAEASIGTYCRFR